MTTQSTYSHQVAVSFDQERAVVRVVGRLTRETEPLVDAVLTTLRNHPVTEVCIDLTGVSVVDRSGAACLDRAHRDCEAAQGRLRWAVLGSDMLWAC
jgi:anti-anti-sigma regulatory factor